MKVRLEVTPPPEPLFPGLGLTKAQRTRTHVIDRELDGVRRATDWDDVRKAVQRASKRLNGMQIFEPGSVKFEVDGETGDIIFSAVELDVLRAKFEPSAIADANLKQTQAGFESSGTLRNLWGYGEVWNGVFLRKGQSLDSTVDSFKADVSMPRPFALPLDLKCEVGDDETSLGAFQSVSAQVLAMKLKLASPSGSTDITAEAALRELIPKRHESLPNAFRASHEVIGAACTPRSKVSVTCSGSVGELIYQSLASPLPTGGALLKNTVEVAGFGGDENHLKLDSSLQAHLPLSEPYMEAPSGACLSLLANVGALFPVSTWASTIFGSPSPSPSSGMESGAKKSAVRARPSHLLDRYYLGGARNMRGFDTKGIAPRALPQRGGVPFGDALGGDFSAWAAVVASAPVPYPSLAKMGVRATASLRAGNVLRHAPTVDDLASEDFGAKFLEDLRTSASVGLAMPVGGPMHIEASYSVPLTFSTSDQGEAFQFSLGIGLG